MRSSLFHAPGDWVGARFTVRDRRSLATWVAILWVLTIPGRYPYRNSVAIVWTLSELAIALALIVWIASETPVETE